MHDALTERESETLSSSLADAISPRGRTGWPRVGEEIAELKRHFAQARTPQDYRNIGNDCVIVLEALSRQGYDAEKHLREGEEEPSIGKTKLRIERFIEDAVPGSDNAQRPSTCKSDDRARSRGEAPGRRESQGGWDRCRLGDLAREHSAPSRRGRLKREQFESL